MASKHHCGKSRILYVPADHSFTILWKNMALMAKNCLLPQFLLFSSTLNHNEKSDHIRIVSSSLWWKRDMNWYPGAISFTHRIDILVQFLSCSLGDWAWIRGNNATFPGNNGLKKQSTTTNNKTKQWQNTLLQ